MTANDCAKPGGARRTERAVSCDDETDSGLELGNIYDNTVVSVGILQRENRERKKTGFTEGLHFYFSHFKYGI